MASGNTGVTSAGGGFVTVRDSKSTLNTDPLRNFRFHVDIGRYGSGKLGFMSVSGLSVNTEVIPYRQGGHNTTTQKMPGQSDFSPITLSQGLAVGDTDFISWVKEIFTVQQGSTQGSPNADFRTTVDIMVLQHPYTGTAQIPVSAAFRVYNAWPSALAFSDLDAGANAIVIQQMTLAHEGWDVKVATDRKTGVSF